MHAQQQRYVGKHSPGDWLSGGKAASRKRNYRCSSCSPPGRFLLHDARQGYAEEIRDGLLNLLIATVPIDMAGDFNRMNTLFFRNIDVALALLKLDDLDLPWIKPIRAK